MYHSHHNAADRVTRGLLGSFIAESKDKSKDFKADSDYALILNDYNVGLTFATFSRTPNRRMGCLGW